MKRLHFAHLAALTMLLFVGAGAQAAPIPPDQVSWTYNFTPGAPAIFADGNPGAGVSFTNEPTKSAVGSSDVVVTNLRVFSSALASSPETLSTNGAYSLALVLTSVVDGNPVSKNLVFNGKLGGTFSAENANVSNVFGPNSTQSVMIGAYNFTVQMIAYTPPGPPDQVNAGSFAAHVTISTLTPQQVPEPSTILLSGLGLSMLGGMAWRKRRSARVAAAV